MTRILPRGWIIACRSGLLPPLRRGGQAGRYWTSAQARGLWAHLAALGLGPVEGVDISAEMLDVAEARGVYQRLFLGDMTARLDVANGAYGAVVSSGTFTTGHVGPEALDEVLRVAATGAQIAISVSEAHWQAAGFAATFDRLAGQIGDLELKRVRIYGEKAEGAHKDDAGFVALFVKG